MTALWQYLLAHCSSFTLFAILPTFLVNAVYLLGSLACHSLDYFPSLRPYRLQQHAATPEQIRRCIKHLLLIKLGIEIPMTMAAYPLLRAVGVSAALPLPSASVIVAQVALFFVIEDAWHYFAHRVLHVKWVYKNVHHIHHRYTAPFGMMANYVHPAETLWTGFGSFLPILLFGPHLLTVCIWIMLRQLQAVVIHVGYRFPWAPSSLLPFIGGAPFHDLHHKKNNYNYAPFFTWFDRLFGTTWPPRAR